jgi:sRNA-binding carbon storage regulator CsrA
MDTPTNFRNLILTRREGECVFIRDSRGELVASVEVVSIRGTEKVRLGFRCAPETLILRAELEEELRATTNTKE